MTAIFVAADLHETENSVQPNRNITDEEKEQRLAQGMQSIFIVFTILYV